MGEAGLREVRDALSNVELALIELELELEEDDPDHELIHGDREGEIERLRAENLRLREIVRRQEESLRKLKASAPPRVRRSEGTS